MQRELRRLADKVEGLSGAAVGPGALDALRLQTREIETAISTASDKAATVDRMERQVAELAAQIEKLVGASPAPAEMTQALRALAEARAEIDRNAPVAAFQALERRMEELGARVEAAARRPVVDPRPLEDVARRVEAIRVALERQAATRPDAAALSTTLQALGDKLDRAFATGSQSAATLTALQAMAERLEETLQRPASGRWTPGRSKTSPAASRRFASRSTVRRRRGPTRPRFPLRFRPSTISSIALLRPARSPPRP